MPKEEQLQGIAAIVEAWLTQRRVGAIARVIGAVPLDLPHSAPTGAVGSGWFDTVDLSGPHTPQSLRRS